MMLQPQQPLQISYHGGLSKFDRAVADSSISWVPTAPIKLTDGGFHVRSLALAPTKTSFHANDVLLQFQLRICPQFRHKPALPSSEVQDHLESDISRPPSLHVASVPPSHSLVINAYPVLRPSYLLLTDSPSHRQSSPLDLSDVCAAWKALTLLESGNGGEKYMVIYNGGKEAGCSRSHKHMQLFPCPSDFTLFPDSSPEEIAKVPYVYALFRFRPSSLGADNSSNIFEDYLSGLQRARVALGIRQGEDVPHNVVIVREWILVIPRRKAGTGGVSANTAGMMGLVWIGSEDEMSQWKRIGVSNILSKLGVAVKEEQRFENIGKPDLG